MLSNMQNDDEEGGEHARSEDIIAQYQTTRIRFWSSGYKR
jgi:hypothetical protein